ncbi:MAG: outer membrane lipoprotein-sorting protein [Gammaproteobacteria bacterium]|nr:outer membrane lipoprotein-sorting protein [Gammaproteobacteria bacterium]
MSLAKITPIACLVLLTVLTPVYGQDAAARGLEIVTEADRRDIGYGDSAATLSMILRNRHGDETSRQIRSRSLEVADDGDKSLIIFDDPADVKGTAFLSFSHKAGDDDQWLYLPALKRVKRISSSTKSGPFMGSEFAYEDMSSQEVEKYTYKYLGEESFDDRNHFRVERYPLDKKSGYTRSIVWVDDQEYRIWKVEYYDRKNALLKTLEMSDFEQYKGQYWRAGKMHMVNHQTGKSTTLLFDDYVFDNGFNDADFNRNSLAKAR